MVIREHNEDDFIRVWDASTEREVYLKTYTWVQNPNNMPGVYKKSGADFRTGIEGDYHFWCIGNPKNGRFEWRRYVSGETAWFQLLPNFKVKTHIWKRGEDSTIYFYKGYLFDGEDDLLLFIYLENEHDYSDKDMVYFAGKRQYLDKLEILP